VSFSHLPRSLGVSPTQIKRGYPHKSAGFFANRPSHTPLGPAFRDTTIGTPQLSTQGRFTSCSTSIDPDFLLPPPVKEIGA